MMHEQRVQARTRMQIEMSPEQVTDHMGNQRHKHTAQRVVTEPPYPGWRKVQKSNTSQPTRFFIAFIAGAGAAVVASIAFFTAFMAVTAFMASIAAMLKLVK